MNVCKSLLRVATQKNPNRIPEWEQRLRRSRTPDEGDHRGFPSYLSVYPALFWRPGSPRPRLCMNVCKSLLRVATQKNPNRIPEWEQRLRRSRTRDEGKPSVGLKGSMHHRLGVFPHISVRALDHVALHEDHGAGDAVEQGRLRLAQRELELAQQRVQSLHRLDRVTYVDVGRKRDLVQRLP